MWAIIKYEFTLDILSADKCSVTVAGVTVSFMLVCVVCMGEWACLSSLLRADQCQLGLVTESYLTPANATLFVRSSVFVCVPVLNSSSALEFLIASLTSEDLLTELCCPLCPCVRLPPTLCTSPYFTCHLLTHLNKPAVSPAIESLSSFSANHRDSNDLTRNGFSGGSEYSGSTGE